MLVQPRVACAIPHAGGGFGFLRAVAAAADVFPAVADGVTVEGAAAAVEACFERVRVGVCRNARAGAGGSTVVGREWEAGVRYSPAVVADEDVLDGAKIGGVMGGAGGEGGEFGIRCELAFG